MASKAIFIGLLCLAATNIAYGQDTVKVSLQEFMTKGVKHVGKIKVKKQNVRLAGNRVKQVKGKRFLPSFTLDTQHGIIPGVKSNRSDLAPNEYYLDPNLKNDFSNLAIFTRVHIKAIQPIFTWGALKDAISAAKSAAQVAESKLQMTKDQIKLKLYKLYQSYLLAIELKRLVKDAQHTISVVNDKLQSEKKSGKKNLSEADLFRFKIFKSKFDIRAAKVNKNVKYIKQVWNYVLGSNKENTVYIPQKRFLDPVQNPIKPVTYYRARAVNQRPEIQALNAGIQAAKYGVQAMKEKNYPKLFAGITGSLAYTPNRPRQTNPFIINKSNYMSAAVGVGIHQNLDFFAMHNDVARSKIKLKKVKKSKAAAIDGIVLQIFEKYKNASVSKIKIHKSYEALTKARRWVRLEEQKADFNRGDPKDLVDALKQELTLKAQYKQAIFSFNTNMAELFKASAIPLSILKTGY